MRSDSLRERHGRPWAGRVENDAFEVRLGEPPEELGTAEPRGNELFGRALTRRLSGDELLQAILRCKRRGLVRVKVRLG